MLTPEGPLPQFDGAFQKRLAGLPLILEGRQVGNGVDHVLRNAREIAAQSRQFRIGTDHLFLSLLREEPVVNAFRQAGIAVDSLNQTLISRQNTSS